MKHDMRMRHIIDTESYKKSDTAGDFVPNNTLRAIRHSAHTLADLKRFGPEKRSRRDAACTRAGLHRP